MPLSQIVSASIEDGAVTPVDLSSVAQYTGFKNRLINGAMVIDQRNAGASVAPTSTSNAYAVDRFSAYATQNSKFTIQQNAGSVTPPTGFSNYLGATSSSAYSVLAADYFGFFQYIEGFNTADLGFGTANASTVTLSFWVRSSLTGTFGGSLTNSAYNRTYPFTYTISAANTWEQKSITVAGDTTGTWVGATNGIGMRVFFSLGTGSTSSGTAGSWAGTGYLSATGATSVVGTNGATFYITGVQLEKGVTATSFDYRPYGTELQLCQRYYEKSYDIDVVPGTATVNGLVLQTVYFSSVNQNGALNFKVPKRAAPTMTYYDSAGTAGRGTYAGSGTWYTGQPVTGLSSCQTGATQLVTGAGYGTSPSFVHFTASAEL